MPVLWRSLNASQKSWRQKLLAYTAVLKRYLTRLVFDCQLPAARGSPWSEKWISYVPFLLELRTLSMPSETSRKAQKAVQKTREILKHFYPSKSKGLLLYVLIHNQVSYMLWRVFGDTVEFKVLLSPKWKILRRRRGVSLRSSIVVPCLRSEIYDRSPLLLWLPFKANNHSIVFMHQPKTFFLFICCWWRARNHRITACEPSFCFRPSYIIINEICCLKFYAIVLLPCLSSPLTLS